MQVFVNISMFVFIMCNANVIYLVYTLEWKNNIVNLNYTSRINEVERRVYWFHLARPFVRPSVRLSVCGQNRVCSVSSTILISSISYLHILSSNFRRCVLCNACWKIWKFGEFFKFCNFDFVFFWLGIQYDSMVWVIMRLQGVSSECRCCSCSSS